MPDWRNKILQQFTPQVSKLTLAADPDGILLEEGILSGIRKQGFDLITFEDHIAFRYAYESKYRTKWDRGDSTELVVVLRAESHELNHLPFDIFQAGRKLSFCLADLFPNLSYPVLRSMNQSCLDALDEALQKHSPPPLSDKATCDFILRYVFQIAPEIIVKPSDLLRILLRKHYQRLVISEILDQRIIEVIGQNELFDDWPLKRIIPSREHFFTFLQERWPLYLEKLAKPETQELKMPKEQYGLEFSGPTDLPFGHDDIRVYLDNLFLEGILKPISFSNAKQITEKWVSVGLFYDEEREKIARLKKILLSVESTIPDEQSSHHSWLSFASKWANLKVYEVASSLKPEANLSQQIFYLQEKVDSVFANWLFNRYAGLYNQPPHPPVMLHHIPRFLANFLNDYPHKKIAFILIDGLSIAQWIILRNVLQDQIPSIQIREDGIFAWIPTITALSRQTAFSGKLPMYFPSSINTTVKEPKQWQQFWSDNGLNPSRIGFLKNLGSSESLQNINELIETPNIKAVGLIINTVDKIMHGMQLGTAGMHSQVKQWVKEGFMQMLITSLFDNKFDIFLSSDHGNVEAIGYGSPKEGVLAETKGERVRIYSDQILRSQVLEKFPDTIQWPPIGLPENYFALIAPDRKAFISENKRTVAHGGITIEEVVVPFIHINRNNKE